MKLALSILLSTATLATSPAIAGISNVKKATYRVAFFIDYFSLMHFVDRIIDRLLYLHALQLNRQAIPGTGSDVKSTA
jgi:hypothetical protein